LEQVSVLIVGVGGQGTLLTSKIYGHLAKEEGLDVKASEVHGMAQRGGSVVTYVKYGKQIFSPLVEEGKADIIMAFELLEALRWRKYLKKGGRLVVGSQRINPMPVITGTMKYPENAVDVIRAECPGALIIDALSIAKEAGNKKSINIVMLGAVAALGEFDKSRWINAIKEISPKGFLDVNLRAFEGGYVAGSSAGAGTGAGANAGIGAGA